MEKGPISGLTETGMKEILRKTREDGKGIFIWAGGDRYEGDFKEGKLDGMGIFIWASGSRYEGGFKEGQQNGMGTFTVGPDSQVSNCPGCVKYVGNWLAGTKQGPGKCLRQRR